MSLKTAIIINKFQLKMISLMNEKNIVLKTIFIRTNVQNLVCLLEVI